MSAWLWAWYQGRQVVAVGPEGMPPTTDVADPELPEPDDPTDPDPTTRV